MRPRRMAAPAPGMRLWTRVANLGPMIVLRGLGSDLWRQEPAQSAVPSQRQLRPGVEQQSAFVPVAQDEPKGGLTFTKGATQKLGMEPSRVRSVSPPLYEPLQGSLHKGGARRRSGRIVQRRPGYSATAIQPQPQLVPPTAFIVPIVLGA
jgi:hypothetical protein